MTKEMSVHIQKRGERWQYRIQYTTSDGVRKSMSKSGFITKKDAKCAGERVKSDLVSKKVNPDNAFPRDIRPEHQHTKLTRHIGRNCGSGYPLPMLAMKVFPLIAYNTVERILPKNADIFRCKIFCLSLFFLRSKMIPYLQHQMHYSLDFIDAEILLCYTIFEEFLTEKEGGQYGTEKGNDL